MGKFILLLSVILLLSMNLLGGCASTVDTLPEVNIDQRVYHQEVHHLALSNFTYVLEPKGVDIWSAYSRIDKPFEGDCEDFAFSLQIQLGGEVMLVYLTSTKGYPWHAVLIKDGIVYDNIFKWGTPVKEYPAIMVRVLRIGDMK